MSSSPKPLRLHEAAAPLALIGVIGAGTFLMVVTRVAASAAAAPGFVVPALGGPMLRALFYAPSGVDPMIGPDGNRLLFWLLTALMGLPVLAAIISVAVWAINRADRVGTARASLAGRRDYRDMRGKGAAERAQKLRPSLGSGPVRAPDLGVRLGRLGRDDLYACEEDVILTVAGPRSNKTSAMVVPSILTAPGPVITTSNKADSFALTVYLRGQFGEVFILDPQSMVGAAQSWWWNPLRNIRDMTDAKRLVTHFVATIGGGSERADTYFTPATERLLSQLVVAAARSGRSLRDVRTWLMARSDLPAQLLEDKGLHSAAAGIRGLLEAPPDQQGGVFETALTAISALESEAVTRYVTPPHTWETAAGELPPAENLIEFDPWQFLVGHRNDERGRPIPRDTLYALTQEGAGSAAPVVAALVDALLFTASSAATAQGGRLDPPLRAVLDEAANICPIKNLPDLYSYFGSKSIQVMTFLQSEAQGVALWGKAGWDKLWSAATVKTVGAGVHSAEFCEAVSRLIGEHDVPTFSDQRGRGGGSSTRSYRRERILAASDIANLTKQDAILICSGRPSGRIRLLPFYTEPEAGTITDYAAEATAEIRRAAITSLGPDNPLAQLLAAREHW
jgi:type IV secretion system protein VirD4